MTGGCLLHQLLHGLQSVTETLLWSRNRSNFQMDCLIRDLGSPACTDSDRHP